MVEASKVSAAEELAAAAVQATKNLSERFQVALAPVILAAWLSDDHAGGRPPERRPASSPPSSSSSGALGSPAEGLVKLGARSQPEQVVAVATYLLELEGRDAVTTDEVLDTYRAARLTRPRNISEPVARAVRRGWLASDGKREGKTVWRVTQSGISAVREWEASSSA